MSDKNHHIDPVFTDQAWLEMKQLLDREMPVRPVPFWFRKRLLWLLLLLIPIGAAWGYYQFRASSGPSTPAVEPSVQPIQTPTEKPIAQANTAGKATSEEPAETDIAVPSSDFTGSTQTRQIEFDALQSTSVAIGSKEGNELHRTIVVEEEEVFLEAAPAERIAAISPLSLLPASLRTVPQAIPSLEGMSASVTVAVNQPRLHKSWQWSVEAGPLVHAGFRSPGLAGGIGLGRDLGRGGWGLQTGLTYAYYARPFPEPTLGTNLRVGDLATLEEILSNEADPFSFDTNVSATQLAASTDSTVSRLHSLEIPVFVTRKLGRRFEINAGGGLGLVLASRTETGKNSGFGLFAGAGAFESDDIASTESSAGATLGELAIFYPFLQGGLTYYPHPRWGLSAQIQTGIGDMLVKWPGKQGVSSIRLGASFRF